MYTPLAVHALATIMMAGLIWFVQLVPYLLLPLAGAEGFARYEREHARRVTWIVAPLMGLEALTAVAWCSWRTPQRYKPSPCVACCSQL